MSHDDFRSLVYMYTELECNSMTVTTSDDIDYMALNDMCNDE